MTTDAGHRQPDADRGDDVRVETDHTGTATNVSGGRAALPTVAAAFSMFSAIPMPAVPWDHRTLRYVLAAFPLVGIAIGALVAVWCAISSALALPRLLFAAGVVSLPPIVTGGIHLDGFADVEDARAAHADRERSLQIISDSHIGSFAAIKLGIYLVIYLGAASALDPCVPTAAAMCCLYVLTRATSGMAVCMFPIAKDSGLAHTFSDTAARRVVAIVDGVLAISCATLAVVAAGIPGAAAVLAVAACLVWYRRLSEKLAGGVTGDLAGWYLQLAELSGLLALVIAQAVTTSLMGGAL